MQPPKSFYRPECYWAHMITFRCNGACPYCLVEGRGKTHRYQELAGPDILKIWNGIKNHDGKKLSIIGGECTLHKDFVEIIQGLKGYNVTITTNLATAFYNDPKFYEKLKVPYKLRVNTTFHPTSGLSPELYAERIRIMRNNGIYVDQIGMVQHPALDKDKWRKKFEEFGLPMRQITFLGFWSEEAGFANSFKVKNLWPNETSDTKKIMSECGIDDIKRFKIQCGASQDSIIEWDCAHGTLCLLVAPDGTLHECHYKLYYNQDSLGNTLGEHKFVEAKHTCSHFGKCNWCDIPRLRMTKLNWKNHKVIKA